MAKNLLLVILSLFVTLSMAEIGLRVMGFRGEITWNLQDVIRVDDTVLNYRLRPNSVSYSGEIVYHLNSRGFRDIERDFAKKENVFRILVLGDSVAFGYKVQLQDTFSRQLESQIRALKKDQAVEVLNLSIPGLNTQQEAHLLLKEGARYDPDLIIVAYSLNDADTGVAYVEAERSCKIQLLNMPVPYKTKALLKSSAFLYLLKDRVDRLLWQWNVGDQDDPLGSIRADFFGTLYNHQANWQDNVVKGFQQIAGFAAQHRIPIVLVVFPVMYDFDRYEWHWIHRKIAAEAVTRDFHVVDLFESYRAHPVKDIRVERGDFVHPGPLGYKIAASVVGDFFGNHPDLIEKPSQH